MCKKNKIGNLQPVLLIAFVLIIQSQFLNSQNRISDSIHSIIRSKKLNDTSLAKQYIFLSASFINNQPDSVIIYAKEGAKLAKSNPKIFADLINTVGAGYFKKSMLDSAEHYYSAALRIREILNLKRKASSSINNLAIIYQIKGDYQKALEMYLKNLKIKEEFNDAQGIAAAYNNIANLYVDQKDPKNALIYQKKVYSIYSTLNDSLYLAQIMCNLGNSYFEMNQFDSCVYLSKKALNVLIRKDDIFTLGQAHNNLGSSYSKLGNYILSKYHFLESVKYFKLIGDSAAIAGSLTNLGQTLFNLKQFDDGIESCSKAELILKKYNYPTKEMYCFQCLYDNYKSIGNTAKALQNYEKYNLIKDTLFNRQKTEEITKLAVSYQFKKQQELIDIEHRKEITLQQKEKKNQQNLMIAGLIILILLIIFTIYVINRLRHSRSQNKLIEKQNSTLEQKQKEILDSIRYAKRIQQSLLPSEFYFLKHLNQNKPKSN